MDEVIEQANKELENGETKSYEEVFGEAQSELAKELKNKKKRGVGWTRKNKDITKKKQKQVKKSRRSNRGKKTNHN